MDKSDKEIYKKLAADNKERFLTVPVKGGNLIIDLTTGVEYFSAEAGFGGGVSVLLNADGKPLLNADAQKWGKA